jgi:proline dehydrogenase
MMGVLDSVIAQTARVVPRPIVQRIAYRYVAGETLEEALGKVSELNGMGCAATVDLLGEGIKDTTPVPATVAEYKKLLSALDSRGLKAGVSVKLTALGLGLDDVLCRANLEEILDHAAEHGRFVRVDMEDHPYTQATLDMVLDVRRSHTNVGVVIQAYLRRSLRDIERLIPMKVSVRLCKGIYNEPRHLAYKDFDLVRENYLLLLEALLQSDCYVGIASHDEYLVWHALRLLRELNRPRDSYEFQMLLGVELRTMLLEAGHRLRVYVPYGKEWYAYSMRRLHENPKMAGYIAKGVFRPTPRLKAQPARGTGVPVPVAQPGGDGARSAEPRAQKAPDQVTPKR